MPHSRFMAAVVAFLAVGSASADDLTLLGVGRLPGTSTDLSGLPDILTDGTPHNRLGGMGSAIAYSGKGNEYVLVSDKGPKEGAIPYQCRMHWMDITVTPAGAVGIKLTATKLLTDSAGKSFVGPMAAANRLDPEGARVGPTGTVFISDEYGPFLQEFTPDGKRIRTFQMPPGFTVRPGKHVEDELPPKVTSGRQPNRGMEGLAISPDGKKLFGLMQGPLIQDGALSPENHRIGVNVRLVEFDIRSGKPGRECVYQLDEPELGLNEILAINDREFLVIERDAKPGDTSKGKKIDRIDISAATDVSGIPRLPSRGLPAGVKPVVKAPFIDLLDPKFGLKKADIPEKIEGLAFGPDLPDGRHLLLVTSDNDFVATASFRVYAFAIPKAALPGYVPQSFEGSSR